MVADSCPTKSASRRHLSLLIFFASHSVSSFSGADGRRVDTNESFLNGNAVTVTNSVLANDSDEVDSCEAEESPWFDFRFRVLLRDFFGALVVELEISSDEKDSEDE